MSQPSRIKRVASDLVGFPQQYANEAAALLISLHDMVVQLQAALHLVQDPKCTDNVRNYVNAVADLLDEDFEAMDTLPLKESP